MAYSEELNMFTVHHYTPIPILHVYTYMCIYPGCDKLGDFQFMASSVWHTDLHVYPTFKNLLNRDYCRVCIGVCRRGAVTMPGLSRPDRIKGKSRTLALQGQVSVEPAKLASPWSQ